MSSHRKKIDNIKKLQFFPLTPVITVPSHIIVHLGAPDEVTENVNVPFIDYIKNVASSELYPTWPENALRANIHAIVSIAMNRIYTEWYRSRGYNFDITNSTQFDQSYVYNRGIYEPISLIADEIFTQYIVREGQVQPLFAQFCDGRISQCNGLSQWGTVELADQGYTPLEILRYYYGEDVSIVTDATVGGVDPTYPGEPLNPGSSNLDVLRMQFYLNRIKVNFPAIPQIFPLDGYYGEDTEAAVRTFQRTFNLPVTGIIDQSTWYRITNIYGAVTKLSELASEGIQLSQWADISSEVYLEGDVRPGVEIIQYGLEVLSTYYPTIPDVAITGIFDSQTRDAIIEFQKTMNLPLTGNITPETYRILYDNVYGILDTLPPEAIYIPYLRWTGIVYGLGHESPVVYLIQEMLSYISLIISAIPSIDSNGIYDEATEEAVRAFQNVEGIEPTGAVDEETWYKIEDVYRRQRFGNVGTNLFTDTAETAIQS
jgi:peptidoglycan hydrolase-like protein with peptidoglycan-binding domain